MLSERTVRNRVSMIFAKIQAADRAQRVLIARQADWAGTPASVADAGQPHPAGWPCAVSECVHTAPGGLNVHW